MDEQEKIINVSNMLPVSTLLQGGKYRIDSYLSSGSFGNTYVATDMQSGNQIAIKEFYVEGLCGRDWGSGSVCVDFTYKEQFASQKVRFLKEAHRLHNLHNDHIIAVHDLFEENETAYYTMDLIHGETLYERLYRTGLPLSEDEVLPIIVQVLNALSVVHANGLYHLDLRPSNIMIDETGRAILIDFAACKQIVKINDTDHYIVPESSLSPGYAPLEQVGHETGHYGPWTDLYALGATIYNLLTPQLPPTSADIALSEPPIFFPSSISSRTKQLILWMMKPRRQERPQNVEEVLKFLNDNPPVEHAFIYPDTDLIEFRYNGASIPSPHHRSYEVTITRSSLRVNVTCYGEPINEGTFTFDNEGFNSLLNFISSLNIRVGQFGEKGAGGGETTKLKLHRKEGYYLSVYTYGDKFYSFEGTTDVNLQLLRREIESRIPDFASLLNNERTMKRKIYVASSWRNGYYPEVVAKLREAGHEVYDFRNPPSGDPGFKWSSVSEDYMEWSPQEYRDMLKHPYAERQFKNDIEAMEACDTCVLVLPCGRSAHTEAGWFAGRGKLTIAYIPEKQEPELMYKLFDGVCCSIDELIETLKHNHVK